MLTENGMEVDQDAMNHVLSSADVLTVGFSLFPQRLLIDTRATDDLGPLVQVVEPVKSVQERYLWLGRHRGMLGAPEAFSYVGWPQTIRGLIERDAMAVMRDRLARLPGDGVQQLEDALEKLRELETAEFQRAIRGEAHWKPLWEAGSATA